MPVLTKLNLAIAKIAAKDASRWSIQGVRITPKETVVTDGKRLVRVKNHEVSDGVSFTIKTQDALDAARIAGKCNVEINPDGERNLRIQAGTSTLIGQAHEGRFPDYEQVIPKDDHTWVEVTFDPKLMKELMDIHHQAGEHVTMRFKHGSPIIMETTRKGQHVQSLLMPYHFKKEEDKPERY